ncbi:phage shock protein PspA [Pseudocolwellia sp. AS88]|uniref:phage shock protein PspA n=1 Tax=Pseudocolwellia sp. AS88 TaxID=3063958 RepID=UPI0026E997F9|nr:phage shock protein PspA [Pseudocolwellia sp. AS88]MDO7083586.1 phage shock protein PspA [Pseudocolwellia sp. AS88]
MGLFTRFTDIINANINSMLDKAEDPEKMIKLIIQEMEETLVDVRSTAAKYIAEKKTLQRQVDNTEKTIASWNTKAEVAVQKGRDDLAKLALKEKYKFTEELTQLAEEMARLDEYLLAVQEDGSRLQEKLIEAKRKQASFVLRQQSAEVRLKVRAQATVHNIDEAISRFERYEQKIDRVEAQVEAYDLAQPTNLESEFRALEAEANLEDELAQLKKQVANA